jgi:hypothetical protein
MPLIPGVGIRDISSWKTLESYIRTLSKDRLDIFNIGNHINSGLIYSFLEQENKIIEDSHATAKNLLGCGRLADASILLDTVENIKSPKFLFSECTNLTSLPDYIELLNVLHDHGSAWILQERLTVHAEADVFGTSFATLNQCRQTSCSFIAQSIGSCLKREFSKEHHGHFFDRLKPIEKLENGLTHLDAKSLIPAIHHALFTKNVRLISEAAKDVAWVNAVDLMGFSALHYATALDYVEGISMLVQLGADVNSKGPCGSTCLCIAA